MTKIHDIRWEKSEQRIWLGIRKIIQKRSVQVQVTGVCRAAGVKPPTFYRHYQNIDCALVEAETRILREFVLSLAEMRLGKEHESDEIEMHLERKRQTEILFRRALRRWLIFVAKNRDFFTMMLSCGNGRLLRESLEEIRGEAIQEWVKRSPESDEERFEIFCGAMMGMIVAWRKRNFNIDEIEGLVNRGMKIWEQS